MSCDRRFSLEFAYVGGESLWSKAQKKAVLSLTKYASTHAESDYDQYLAEIAVPEGDRIARQQLLSASPDMKLVHRGFVQGRNHPDDVESMAMLFRRFGHFGYMAEAIAIWTEGDRYIDQLRERADALHTEINAKHPDAEKIQHIATDVADVDARITPLEDAFSSTLGEGACWANTVLSIVSLVATGLLLFLGIGLSSAIVKRIRHSDEKYRSLINAANDAILVIDSERRVVLEANKRACEILDIPEEQLVGMPESRLYYERQLRQALNLGALERRELELLRADGAPVPVEASVSMTEVGGRAALLGIFRDIRERLEAAAVLQRRETRFGHLIQNQQSRTTIPSTGMETILLAEDQPELRWMICRFLQERGYSVLEATDGRDAVELAEQYNSAIDVVLTDIVMPFLRGPEVARRISESRPQIKVIFMSGYTEGEVTPEGQNGWKGRQLCCRSRSNWIYWP